MSDRGTQVVVELTKRGKLVVGEPFFVPGVPLVVDRRGLGDARPGDLAVVDPDRGRARLERVLGRANDIDAVLEGVLVHTQSRTEFEPYDRRERELEASRR